MAIKAIGRRNLWVAVLALATVVPPVAAQEVHVVAQGTHSVVLRTGILQLWYTENDGCPGGEFAPPCRILAISGRPTEFDGTVAYEAGVEADSVHSRNIAINGAGGFAWLSKDHLLERSGATVLATRSESGSLDDEVVADNEYYYWSDGDVIKRTPRHGGTTEIMVNAAGPVDNLATDGYGGVLYTASFGILYNVSPGFTPGTFNTVVGPANVLRFTRDDTYVYAVAETGGGQVQTLHRAPVVNISSFTAGVQIGSVPAGDDGLESMTSNYDWLFWYKTGDSPSAKVIQRLRKADWNASPAAIESITPPINTLFDLVATPDYLFFRGSNTIQRVELDTAVNIFAELAIAEVVVNQGVSGIDDFLLIEDKPGIVWVEPTVNSLSGVSQVTARVDLRRLDSLGNPVPGVPALTRTKSLNTTPVNRDNPDTVFNFQMPPSWLTGAGSIEATIRPVGMAGTGASDSAILPAEGFRPKTHVCVKFLPLWLENANTYWVTPPDQPRGFRTPGFLDILRRFETVYPVPELRYYTQTRVLRKPQFLGPNRPFNMAANGSGPSADSDHLMAALFEHNIYDVAPNYCGGSNARTHYVAMVPASINTTFGGRTVQARGSLGEPFVWLKMRNLLTGFNSADAGTTMAHEFGHNFNNLRGDTDHWQHVNCGLAAGAGFNDLYPFDHCTFGLSLESPGDNDGMGGMTAFEGWGADRISGERVRFTEASDYLSNAANRWASFYRWQQAMTKIEDKPGAGRQPVRRMPVTSDAIVIAGVVDGTESTIEVLTLNHFPAGFEVPDVNTEIADQCPTAFLYELVVEDAFGSEIARHKINPTCSEDDDVIAGYYFLNTRPYAPGASMLRIVQDDNEIWSFEITEEAPTVDILSPAPGETLNAPFSIAWDAQDGDSPTLTYTVQYRIDGADTPWMLLSSGLDEPILDIDANDDIPGSSAAEIRVIASDGFNIGMAVVEPVNVADKPPAPAILYPLPGQAFSILDTVTLEGRGFDPETGDATLSWTVSGVASASASGKQALIDDFPPGLYDVTLSATDVGSNTAMTMSSFVVEDKFVPDTAAPVFDGACEDEVYTHDHTPITLRYGQERYASAQFVHNGSHLWVCVSDLDLRVWAVNSVVTLSFDADASGDALPQPGDMTVRMFQNGALQTQTGAGPAVWIVDSPASGAQFLRLSAGGTSWSAEARIDLARLGGWNHFASVALSHADFGTGETFAWPRGFDGTNPSTWGHTAFGGALTQTISLDPIADTPLEMMWVAAAASASSGLPVEIVTDTPAVCSVGTGNIVYLLAGGACSLRANQPGNAVYLPAAEVLRSFSVIIDIDTDGDGIDDSSDNCTFVANPQQRDTDQDNIGNFCDPDIAQPNDCMVNFADLNAIKLAFFSTPSVQQWNPDADFNGNDSVNFSDLNIIKGFFFGTPGPSGLTNACD